MQELFPVNISPDAGVIDALFFLGLKLTGASFAVVVGLLFFFIVKYRAREGHKAEYFHGDSGRAAALTLLLAFVVFVGIDVVLAFFDHHAYSLLYGNPPKEDEALVVQVFAKQYEWNFRYAGADKRFGTEDDITSINKLVIPKNKKILLQMQSMDVIHSLFIPSIRCKQDVVPGLTVGMWFEVNRSTKEERRARGDKKFNFEIACAELCGQNHTNMRARLVVYEPEEFREWYEEEEEFAEDYDQPEIWRLWGRQSRERAARADMPEQGRVQEI